MVFLASGGPKTKKNFGPGLKSYHETYGNSLISYSSPGNDHQKKGVKGILRNNIFDFVTLFGLVMR